MQCVPAAPPVAGAQIHAQRHALRRDAERLQRLDNGRACSRHLIGKPQDHCLAQTPAPTPAAAVADAMQRDQLAASDMHHAGTAQQLGSGHRDQAAIARKNGLDHIERRTPVFIADGSDRT